MATQAQKLKSLTTDEKFDYIVNELSEMKSDIKELKSDVKDIKGRLSNVEKEVKEIKSVIEKIKVVIPVPIENANFLVAKVKKKTPAKP